MNITVVEDSVTQIVTPLLVVNLFEGATGTTGATGAVNAALDGLIANLIADREITGKLNEVTVVHTGGKIGARRVAVVGLGKPEEFSPDRVRQASGVVAKHAGHLKITQIATIPHGAGVGGLSSEVSAQAIVEGTMLGAYDYRRFKTVSDELPPPLEGLTIVEQDKGKAEPLRQGAKVGDVASRATMLARDLSNGPANVVTPSYLADQARMVAEQFGLRYEALGPQDLSQHGFRTLLAVAEGSVQEPRLISLRYEGRGGGKTLAVVGKGITFDSGGISIKPAEGMWFMKHDMSGAAATIGFVQAAAELKLGLNVVGVMPATENMPGGRATKPGDIVTSYSGKTIEIQNTDAEGRLVLADALAYAAEQKPDVIVDLATLTGACVVALGTLASGGFSNNDDLLKLIEEAGTFSGERVWPLPVWKEYGEELKSEVADLKNIGAGRYGGAILGASFLSNFVGGLPWVHLDIAGTAWTEKELPYIPKGASGVGVRLLLEFARRWQDAR